MKTQKWPAHGGYGRGPRQGQCRAIGMASGMTNRRQRVTKWSRVRSEVEPRETDEIIADMDAGLSLLDLVEVLSVEVHSTMRYIFPDADEE